MPTKKSKTTARVRRVRYTEILEAITPERIQSTAHTVAPRHLALVLAEAPSLERAFKRSPLTKLREEAADGLRLLADFAAGSYGEVPYQSVSILVFAYRYVLHDEDLIPGPVGARMSKVDDERVFRLAIGLVKKDLTAYGKWRRKKR